MANKQYTQQETSITFKESGGSATFTPKNIATGAGRVSAQYDLGAAPRADRFIWTYELQHQATPTAGAGSNIYLSRGHTSSENEGNPGTSDAGLSAETACDNMLPLGSVRVETATADKVFRASGVVMIPHRYVSVAAFNNGGSSWTNDAAEHIFTLTPVPPESQ